MKYKAITVAIVEDHALVRNGLVTILRKYGFDILFVAEHGKDFFDQLTICETTPDVCIMDLNMPVMNGFITIAKIREQEIPTGVIAFTMNNSEEYVQRAKQIGADECILKGEPPGSLADAVKRVSEICHVQE